MSDKRGFTLLEVVVALMIAGLALVALFQAGSGGLSSVDVASNADEALQRAQSHLAALGRDVALVQGDSEGDDGGGYRWHLHVQPVAMKPVIAVDRISATNLALFDVDVSIRWGRGRHQREVTLRTQRLAAIVAAQ